MPSLDNQFAAEGVDVSLLPEGFCYLHDIAPSILVDIKYSTTDNLTGRIIDGYNANVAICTVDAAYALRAANAELNTLGLGLKVFDAYRPLKAGKFFKKWAESEDSSSEAKAKYYPDIDKSDIMNGYFAEFSNHSRGSAIDLTIMHLETGEELDMGTVFDFLGELSHTHCNKISKEVVMNRALLVELMDKYGFDNYRKEWWHYELRDEPFPKAEGYCFNFDIEYS